MVGTTWQPSLPGDSGLWGHGKLGTQHCHSFRAGEGAQCEEWPQSIGSTNTKTGFPIVTTQDNSEMRKTEL